MADEKINTNILSDFASLLERKVSESSVFVANSLNRDLPDISLNKRLLMYYNFLYVVRKEGITWGMRKDGTWCASCVHQDIESAEKNTILTTLKKHVASLSKVSSLTILTDVPLTLSELSFIPWKVNIIAID